MARDPNSPALSADYEALVAQLAELRRDMADLASQVGTTAAHSGKAMADTVSNSLTDAKAYAGQRAHEADLRIGHAVAANPYMALGLAAGLGLLLGAMSRR